MVEKTLTAEMANFDLFMDFVRENVAKSGFDKGWLNKLVLAAEEAIVNVIHYAYPGGPGKLQVICNMPAGKNGIIVELRDSGIAFNPLGRPEPDISVPVEKRPIGGLGIMLIKKTMDELKYKRENNQNIFTMTKYL